LWAGKKERDKIRETLLVRSAESFWVVREPSLQKKVPEYHRKRVPSSNKIFFGISTAEHSSLMIA
jgi:hypothetical protein